MFVCCLCGCKVIDLDEHLRRLYNVKFDLERMGRCLVSCEVIIEYAAKYVGRVARGQEC